MKFGFYARALDDLWIMASYQAQHRATDNLLRQNSYRCCVAPASVCLNCEAGQLFGLSRVAVADLGIG